MREIRFEHAGIVGVQRDRHAGIEQPSAPDASPSDATAPVFTLLVMQTSSGICSSRSRRIRSGSSTARMPWPIRSAPISSAARMESRPVRFSRVRGQAQARIFRVPIRIAERQRRARAPRRRRSRMRSRHHPHTRGEPRDFHHVVRAELADGIEIPPDFDGPLLSASCCASRIARQTESKSNPRHRTTPRRASLRRK